MSTEALLARLDAIDAKLERIDRRQRVIENLVDEMTPVVREVMRSTGVTLAEYEARGYFAVGRELLSLVDRVVVEYGADEVAELGGHVVEILDTVRNLTQSEVLDVVNEATDVLHEADSLEPVGPFRALKATGDEDVQRGLAVALEVLRHLGRHHPDGDRAPRPERTRPAPKPAAAAAPPAPEPKDSACAVPVAPAPDPGEVVQWKGHAFTGEGFLVEPSEWSEALGSEIAAALDQPLTEEHWQVVRWARQEFLTNGASPNVRRVSTGSGVGTKRVYQLFPKSPGKTIARIAGVPKPVGCI